MRSWGGNHRAQLLCSAAFVSTMLAAPAVAQAQSVEFDIPPQSLSAALDTFAAQSRQPILVTPDMTANKTSQGVQGATETRLALAQLLEGTGLTYKVSGKTFLIVSAQAPQGGSAAGGGATVEALIVTAQKREEDIQDVPIAISAFSQEDLERSQIAGGPDLITQVPNMTFTKTNFSSYSIQIRGIGTQAISATTDPAVSVAFNNTPFIRNHFFEQEFYDLQRVEVLRGPQGTLYGRNATAGVVNVISAKPKFRFEAKASADVANYNTTRIEGMVNVPLVEDAVALRLAGAWTKRDGYAFNEIDGKPIDGRDLWSTRVSLRISPSSAFDMNLIWEHFEEDDDRLRSGKQLCTKDVVTKLGNFDVDLLTGLPNTGQGGGDNGSFAGVQGTLSQGCKRGSLYSPDAFQTPMGLMLPYYAPLTVIGLVANQDRPDPYVSTVQSRDLRVIESTVPPEYRAKSDLGQLQVSFEVAEGLTLTSETAYATDLIYSLQDFNRFNTAPGAWGFGPPNTTSANGVFRFDEDGQRIFCDPQLGCAGRLIGVDVSTAKSRSFSQEFRLGSDFDGPFNFSIGANYLRYDTEDKYYVFINSLSQIVANRGEADRGYGPYENNVTDNSNCLFSGLAQGDPSSVYGVFGCIYMDPNPIHEVNDQGHNYFLSRNPYKLISYAMFGEAYYQLAENLKVTAGLRWTVDKKDAPRLPTWILAEQSVGYPVLEVVEQEWREPSGRLAIDWKPDLSFTDETLLYGSYAHGYKAGGANPPPFVRVYYADTGIAGSLSEESATRPTTFDPEFVDAFELGAKNTLADGKVTLNLAAFYYDYEAYQISEIVDRSAFNRNFDATIWGVELEADWRPLENLKFGLKVGYENTRIADGEKAIDLMDRSNGNQLDYVKDGEGNLVLDDSGDPIPFHWLVVRPFPTQASSCILPDYLFTHDNLKYNPGGVEGGNPGGCEEAYVLGLDPISDQPYDPNYAGPTGGIFGNWPDYPGFDPASAPNNGEGIDKELGGNELPNAPNWTSSITVDYTVPLAGDWLATLHTDLYWQSESWWRVFNDHPYAKLKAYTNVNLAAIFNNEESGWRVMAFVKNVFDRDSITGAFLFSDDTGLTTNVFLTEPRLYGLRVSKTWTGGPLLGSFGERRDNYPFTLELGGQVQRHDAPNETFAPMFTDAFDPALDPSQEQEKDLDWGDGREIKLTYNPNETWKIALGARFGKTNGGNGRSHRQGEKLYACYGDAPCPEQPGFNGRAYFSNYGLSELWEKEEHAVVDFTIGRDFGLGIDGMESSVSAGLRYANFTSHIEAAMQGTPDWDMPENGGWGTLPYLANYGKYLGEVRHHEYAAEMTAKRTFKGVGPVLTWDAAKSLADWGDDGHLDVDWSITGGVLFGKQKASGEGSIEGAYFEESNYDVIDAEPPTSSYSTELSFPTRDKSVTAPVLGASLGLSYKVGGFSAGAGYRWERYYDAIDGGISEAKQYDRTIDGPYFKLSVGFGG